ncbi:MAG: ImmA/IrrE family metallo-endopeptidase [Amoebophilaceae bacterium]|nr:ImmA/IrrE family metallo-endopeptidase [Amoebophilaceae bacterium]
MNASQVLNTYYQDGTLPVDLHYIAAQVNIKIEYINAPDDYCGELDTDVDPILIKVNKNHAETRQRFTIAHELGHYFLGHGSRNRIIDNRSNMYSYDPVEYLANDFAAKLLMNEIYINHLLKHKKINNLSDVANKFNVSLDAAKIRCKNLGLL